MKKIISKMFAIYPYNKKWEYQLSIILGPFIVFAFIMAFVNGEHNEFSIYDFFVVAGQFWIVGSIFSRLLYAEKNIIK